jgi:hypothetical protein
MSVVTDILNLRRNQTSSVELFLSALEWQKCATEAEHILSRGYAVTEAADLILLNVAAHAAEALAEPRTIRKARRSVPTSRRNRRRSDSGPLQQRRFAVA